MIGLLSVIQRILLPPPVKGARGMFRSQGITRSIRKGITYPMEHPPAPLHKGEKNSVVNFQQCKDNTSRAPNVLGCPPMSADVLKCPDKGEKG